MNGIPGRSLPGAAIAAIVLTAAPVAFAAAGNTPVVDSHARNARAEIVKAYHDGPWLKPTLELLRSEDEWTRQMDKWVADEIVIGPEDAPPVDWKHQAVVVLSLGSCFGQVGVTLKDCQVEGDKTILDLHFQMSDQWDPNGEPSHPAVILAVDRADLKDIELICDATVDGLPPGLSRKLPRVNGAGTTTGATEVAIAPTLDNVSLGETKTTWGRVKAGYRGVVSR